LKALRTSPPAVLFFSTTKQMSNTFALMGALGRALRMAKPPWRPAPKSQNGRDYGLGAGGAFCVFAEGADNASWYELCIRQTRRKIG